MEIVVGLFFCVRGCLMPITISLQGGGIFNLCFLFFFFLCHCHVNMETQCTSTTCRSKITFCFGMKLVISFDGGVEPRLNKRKQIALRRLSARAHIKNCWSNLINFPFSPSSFSAILPNSKLLCSLPNLSWEWNNRKSFFR